MRNKIIKDKEEEVSDDDLDSLKSFIDDSEVENDRTFYQQFENVSSSIDDILKEEYDKSMGDIEKLELSNLCENPQEEGEIDILRKVKKEKINLKKFCSVCLVAKMIIATHLLMQYFMQ